MKKTYFKVGDLVTCPMYGKGKVKSDSNHPIWPIVVKFNNGLEFNYTHDGRWITGANESFLRAI